MHNNPTTGRPIVAQAVRALKSYGDPLDRAQAATLLPLWRHYPALEQHEQAAVLAHFPPAQERTTCAGCGGTLEHVTDGPDPGWWRHLDPGRAYDQVCPGATPGGSAA